MKKTARKTTGMSSNGDKRSRQRGTSPRFDLVKQGTEIEQLLQQAVNHELSIHKRLGNPIAAWRDGKVIIVPPEEIVISAEE